MHITTTATILLLGATSTDNVLHAVPKELSVIKQLFDDKNSPALSFQVEYEPYFTQDGLKKLLDRLTNKVAILHFAGHSNAEGLLTDDKLVYSQHIAEIIKSWTIQPTLIFLNGCQNQQQVQLFLDAGVANIIATHKPIDDQQASQFALEFYTSLFSSNADLPLQVAFKQASEKVFLDKQGQSRSLMIESLDQTDSDSWDWGLFEKYPNTEQQWTLQRLLSEDRPQLDNNGNLLNPYKGLQAFKEEDQLWFFGREVLAKELTKSIQESQFFTLLGASGSGKSSLINAAVIPQLRHDSNSLILKTNPANAPFVELAGIFCELLYPNSLTQRLSEQKALTQQLREQQILISDLVKPLLQTTEKTKLYLCIDQFEELFTQSPQPIIQNFLHQLIQLINTQKDCCLILIMRADFLASALANSEFAELMDKHPHKLLAPMAKAELREAIEKPATKQRIQLEPSLLEALLDDIENRSGYLPLLQYTLNLLWDKRQGTTIKLADYTALGGLKKVLETRANEIYQGFSKQQQDHCKQIFLRLIQPGEGTEDTRRRASLDEFDQQDKSLQATLKTLADARLITTLKDNESKQAYAEISHEALIKYWPELREWIAENRDQLRTQHQISAGAKEWLQHDHDRAWLLSGSRLVIAEEWFSGNTIRATKLEKEFIQKAIEERDRQAQTEEKRRKRNRNVLMVFLTALTVIALFALTQWQSANKARVIADQKTEIADKARITANKKTVIAKQEVKKAKQAKEEAEKAKKKTEVKILESNFFLAKSYEEKALRALEKGDLIQKEGDKSITEYQKAWLYALEAEKLSLPKDKIALKYASLVNLTNFSAQAISPERRSTPRPLDIGSTTAITYSPDGKVLVFGSYDHMVRLWDANSGELLQTLKGHTDYVTSVAYSPNGKLFASASGDKTVRLWDANTSELRKIFKGHTAEITKVVFSPDSKQLASASVDKTVRLWDINTSKLLQILKGHTSSVMSIAYNPNEKLLASGGNTVRLWDTNTGKLRQILKKQAIARPTGYSAIDKLLASSSFGGTDQASVSSVVYSPDGKQLASASYDGTVRLWDSNTNTLQQILKGHTEGVTSVAYSSNGKMLVSSSLDKSIRLWDAETGRLQQILKGETSNIKAVVFSPDNKFLIFSLGVGGRTIRLWNIRTSKLQHAFYGATGGIRSVMYASNGKLFAFSSGKEIQIWNANASELRQIFKGHTKDINSLAYNPNGKLLASASADKTVRLWDANTGELQQILKGHTEGVNSVAFSPDGKIIASASIDGTIRLWNSNTGILKQILKGHTKGVSSVMYSPDGKLLASSSWDNTVRLWNTSTGELQQELKGHTKRVYSVAYSPNSTLLASASRDQNIRVWDVVTGELQHILKGHTDSVTSVAYSPNGKLLASASRDNTVILWNVNTGKLQKTFKGHTRGVLSVAFSPDGKQLASSSYDQTLRFWDTNIDKPRQTFKGHTRNIYSVVYSPDGKLLASASGAKIVKLWDTKTGELRQTLKDDTGTLISVAYSPDGKQLASVSLDKMVRLWDIKTGNLQQTLKYTEPDDPRKIKLRFSVTPRPPFFDLIYSVAYSPDGKLLASVSRDKLIRIWNAYTGELQQVLKDHTSDVSSVAYSPDGKLLASASYDKTIRLWDANTGEFQQLLKGHTDSVTSVTFSPNGKQIASGSKDKTVRLWETNTGKLQQTLKEHRGIVSSVAYSDDGEQLASASYDGIVGLWDTNTGELQGTLKGHTDIVTSVAYSPKGNQLASASWDKSIHIWGQNQMTTLYLFYGFDSKQVSDALKFLWEMGLDKENFEFIHQARTPTLYPKQGYYYEDVQFLPLLDMPKKDESKMDQLVRFLEARCAYKDKIKAENCTAKNHPKEIKHEK